MLAIFEEGVATPPTCILNLHVNVVKELKDGFLAKHFASVYPDSVVISSLTSFTFAYSPETSSTSPPERNHFAQIDGVYCMYQGFIKDIDAVKRDFHISDIDDEGIVMIRAFKTLRRLGQKIPKKAVENLFGNCASVFYEMPRKLVVLAVGSDHSLPMYWGIDTRFKIVISTTKNIVEKACGCADVFLSGQIYASCDGWTGQEALYLNKQLPYKVDFSDKYFPIRNRVETITEIILEADNDRRFVRSWEPPLPDFMKINTHGVELSGGMLGIGIVMRNSKGDVECASTRRTENAFPDLGPEFQAFIKGFYEAAYLELPRFICESRHLHLEMIKDKYRVSGITKDLLQIHGQYILGALSEFSVSFVLESANTAAYYLAGLAETVDYRYWMRETPDCIASIVEFERPILDTTFPDF